jgi:hypothetical protein
MQSSGSGSNLLEVVGTVKVKTDFKEVER